ncbi:MAG: ArsB/NhaD family transporter [Chloroflexi bacterium]|nr:ArsB/NhaD family transporter [Chloroflexota bacterium]
MSDSWLAGGVFLLCYGFIVTERMHRTLAALLGGVTMIVLGILPQEAAFGAVDWNVIFLLAGMMSIANILRETGLFQWIAVQAVRLGKGDPLRILMILSVVTALFSALLDNVTIVVLVVPVTLFVTGSLGVSPLPFLVAEILASNIGGAATLIGDPPNVLIGSAAGIDFLAFAVNMGPVVLIILALFLLQMWLIFGKQLRAGRGHAADLEALDTQALVTDRALLARGLAVLIAVVAGFQLHGALSLEPATIALTGATLLMVWGRRDPHKVLRDVEWTTLFFFVGLFIVVEAVVQVGIIERAGQAAIRLTKGNVGLTSLLLLWLSALVAGVVDNIPCTATMIPLVRGLGQAMPLEPLWWSLALGGNATLVGMASLAERSGYHITFHDFLRYSLATTALSLLVASGYIWIRYL